MKSLFVFAAVVFCAFFISCSSLSVAPDNSQTGGKVIHFIANFGVEESLAKTTANGINNDGLTTAERKALLNYMKSRQTRINLRLLQDFTAIYSFNFPIINGVCEGDIKVDTGNYLVNCFSAGEIKAGLDTISVSDFSYVTKIEVKGDDTIQLNIILKTRGYIVASLYLSNGTTPLNGKLDSLFAVSVIGTYAYSDTPRAVNGYARPIDFFPIKKNFNFSMNGKRYAGLFDITKVIDNNVVEVSLSEVPQSVIQSSVTFADDVKPAVDSVFPKENADNVPTDIQNIVAYFNKGLADWSDMPGVQFGIASENGNDQITGTYALSGNIFSRQLAATSERVYLKPNTKYIAHVSAVKDKFGNEMVGEKRWSFTTGN
jgi:hypothetical protein